MWPARAIRGVVAAHGCLAVALFLLAARAVMGGSPQLVSTLPSDSQPPSTAAGNSFAPIVSADGRFVVFASTASNLLPLTNSSATVGFPAINVFRRDRQQGTTSLISVDSAGAAPADGDTLPIGLSSDNRYVLLQSDATNLVPNDTNHAADIFLRDLVTERTVLVSLGVAGNQANGPSRTACMSSDARWVAFVSTGDNLCPEDTNRLADIYVRDTYSNSTLLVSSGSGVRPGRKQSFDMPEISPDGRKVAFCSLLSDSYKPIQAQIYVYDLVTRTTLHVSAGASAAALSVWGDTNVICYNHVLSHSGGHVAYEVNPSSASVGPWNPPPRAGLICWYDLDNGSSLVLATNGYNPVVGYELRRDLDISPDGRYTTFLAYTDTNSQTTAVYLADSHADSVRLLSGDPVGEVTRNSLCAWPRFAGSNSVVFLSTARNLVTNCLSGEYNLFRRNFEANETILLNRDPDGGASPVLADTLPSVTPDGNLIAFEAPDGALVAEDSNFGSDVFLHDVAGGRTELISCRDAAMPAGTPAGNRTLVPGGISVDGRYVAYSAPGRGLGTNINGAPNVFLKDLYTGPNVLVSTSGSGGCADGASVDAILSSDGNWLAFSSSADNILPEKTNSSFAVFLRDLRTGETELATPQTPGNGYGRPEWRPLGFSASNRYLLMSCYGYVSLSKTTGLFLFCRDLIEKTNFLLSTTPVRCANLSPNGRFLTYLQSANGSYGPLYVLDCERKAFMYTNKSYYLLAGGCSGDGSKIAFWKGGSSPGLSVIDFHLGTNETLVFTGSAGYPPLVKFSADGNLLAFNALSGQSNQVFLFDFSKAETTLISRGAELSSPAQGYSSYVDISADGRFVAYQSDASDLVPGGGNDTDVYLYDVAKQETIRLGDGAGANCPRYAPMFSRDGRTLVFNSWASNLAKGDYNQGSDLFAASLFYSIVLPAAGADGVWLSWPYDSSSVQKVEYKEDLSEERWTPLGGAFTNSGPRAWMRDASTNANRRFYRIITE